MAWTLIFRQAFLLRSFPDEDPLLQSRCTNNTALRPGRFAPSMSTIQQPQKVFLHPQNFRFVRTAVSATSICCCFAESPLRRNSTTTYRIEFARATKLVQSRLRHPQKYKNSSNVRSRASLTPIRRSPPCRQHCWPVCALLSSALARFLSSLISDTQSRTWAAPDRMAARVALPAHVEAKSVSSGSPWSEMD